MRGFIIRNFFPILLIFISIVICIANYTPGTFLSGWDTIHPEFNFGEYFKRILFGVWESHQGLGAISSQAHPAELPRMILYYPLSFLLPLSFLRYSYFFLTLILGPLGVYFFIKKAILKEDNLQNKVSAFGGSLFYLLNLGTVQHYFVPLEMFATHFATIGWLFLFIVRFLDKGRRLDLLILAILTFFSAPIAHTPTLWYAYFLSILVFLATYNVIQKNKQTFFRSIKIVLLTLFINLFWILPNIYFIFASGNSVSESKIHYLFSEEAFAKNKEFGTLLDTLIFKNFLFDWGQYIGNGKFAPLLTTWINHLKNPLVLIIGYVFALIAILGTLFSIKKRNLLLLSLLPILLLSGFFLFNNNPPLGFLFTFLQKTIPFFQEALRFPFTKFSIIFMFVFSCYLAFGVNIIVHKFKSLTLPIFIAIIFLLSFYMLPAFSGNLIDPMMKVKIPQEYFSLFKWFDTKPHGRIANLPIQSFWGWDYHSWDYQGAGFLWFGLKDPLLDREFDRWNPKNEQYYREMSQAIYSQNLTSFNNVVDKYDITYILLDKSIIAPDQGTNSKILFLDEIQTLLKNSPGLTKAFEEGNLIVYQKNGQNQTVRIVTNPTSISPESPALYDDFAYLKYKDYITHPESQDNEIVFPNRNIIDNQNRFVKEDFFSYLASQKISTNITQSGTSDNDCPSNVQIKPKKNILDGFARYTSLEGSFCDHYSYPTLPRNQGYLISVASRNVQGLPLKICVTNYLSGRCDLYTQLSIFPDFEKDVLLLPPMDEGVGFDINFNNFGVKRNPSINDLKSIEITPFSYLELSQIEQYNPAGDSKNINVIAYSQSFDKGWKAYEVQNEKLKIKSWINNIFPFVFGKEIKEHVLVNNWANGWLLDDNQLQTTNHKLVIIFWPQYLEYIGLIVLAITFILLFKNHMPRAPSIIKRINLLHPKTLLITIIILVLGGNFLWVRINTLPPFYDSAGHTNLAFAYTDIFTGQRNLSSLKEFFTVSNYYPPLLFIIGGILTTIFGYDYKVLQFGSVLLLGLSTFFLYLYTKELTRNKNLSLVTAAIFVILPHVWEQSRYFMLDLPLTLFILISLFFLEKSENFKKTRYASLFFLFASFAQLTKWYAIIYLAIPIIFTVYRFIKLNPNVKKILTTFVFGLALGLILILPWYILNFSDILNSGKLFANPDFGDPINLLSVRNVLFYPILLVNYQVVSLQIIILVIGMVFFFKERPREKLLFGLEILLIYFTFTFIGNKNLRYTLPLLPFLAIIMAYGALRILDYGRKGKIILSSFFIFSLIVFFINSFSFPIKNNFRISLDFNKLNKNLDNLYLLDLSSKDVPYLFTSTPLVGREIIKDLSSQLQTSLSVLVASNNPQISVAGLSLFNRNENIRFFDLPSDNAETIREQKIEEIVNKNDYLLIPSKVVAPPGQINYFNLDETRKYILSGKTRNFALIKTYTLQNNDSLFLLKKDALYNIINLQVDKKLIISRPKAVAEIYIQFMDPTFRWSQQVIAQDQTFFEKDLTNVSRFRIDYPPHLIKATGSGWTYDQDKQFDKTVK